MKRIVLLMVLLGMLACFVGAQAQSVPYTVKLNGSDEIYRGHGVDYGYARDVGQDGVYTIVEEAYDEYGNLWGRLKSGAGWVMLEEAKDKTVYIHDLPFTTKLEGSEDICAGPGYEYGYTREVGNDGVYTIVEEAIGDDGFLWGKLKSGAGWVRLTDAPMEVPEYSYDTDYTVSLGGWVSIWDRPDEMEATCVGIVGEDGVFTIVDEVQDELGNVWGKLKSGAGWVNLNYVRYMGDPAITAYFADVVDDIEPEWCDYVLDDSAYMVRIAFRANERIEDISFQTLQYGDEYEVEATHSWIQWMEKGEYYVVGVVFYGDMTTYGISFTDEYGEERNYAVSISGMNGALVMNEYVQ